MEKVRFFEVDVSDVNYLEMVKIATAPVMSLDGTKAIIKLHKSDIKEYPFFNGYQLIPYPLCLKLRRSAAYQNPLQ